MRKRKLVEVKQEVSNGLDGVSIYIDGEFSMNTIHAKSLFKELALIDALDDFYKITFVTKQEIQK
jgi:hypothetical protein